MQQHMNVKQCKDQSVHKDSVGTSCPVCSSQPAGRHAGAVLARYVGDGKGRIRGRPTWRAAPAESATDRTSYGDTENIVQYHIWHIEAQGWWGTKDNLIISAMSLSMFYW